MKRFIITFLITLPLLSNAQTVKNVEFFPEGDNVIISYTLTDNASTINLFLSQNGGEWEQLNEVSGDVGNNIPSGDKRIVWDIYKEMPKGISDRVSFAVVPNYSKPSAEQLPSNFPKGNMVIRGNKAYGVAQKNYSKEYAGDIRKGTYASATDKISFTIEIYEYDFITKEMSKIDSFGWSGRVARKKPYGDARFTRFPIEEIPQFRLHSDNSGFVCIDNKIVTK